jgi:hypothetical protein
MSNAETVASIIPQAFGSEYAGKPWQKDGAARVYVTARGKPIGHITVSAHGPITTDTSALRMPSSAHGKTDAWLAAELAQVSA